MTEPAPRQNRDGDACPPWCDRDHGDDDANVHIRQTGTIRFGDEGLDSIWACAILAEHHHGHPEVGITGHQFRSGSFHVAMPAHRAEDLAALAEMLAGATPDQHRELAAAIRKAAAQITDPSGG